MYTNSDWIRAITKLIQLTVDGDLSWRPWEYEPEEFARTDRVFRSHKGDKAYVVGYGQIRVFTDVDEWHTEGSNIFEIWTAHPNGTPHERIAVSPDFAVTSNLYRMIVSKFAFDKNALGDLLTDD